MNRTNVVAFLLALCVASSVAGLRAGPPPPAQNQLTFNARITQGGQPVSGLVPLRFELVDSATPGQGNVLWAEDHDGTGAPKVPCSNGIFSVVLGAAVPIPPGAFTPGGGDRWVAVRLAGQELTRVKLTASAYAVVSTVAGAVWDPATSAPLDLDALDGRYVEATGDAVVLNGDVTGSGKWLATAVEATHGGTGQTTWQRGDLLYAVSETETVRLPAGQEGQVLTMRDGVPAWSTPPSRARYALRYFPTATRTLVVPTGFKPRMVLVGGASFFASMGAAMSPDGQVPASDVVQAGLAWDVTGTGGFAHDDKVFPHSGCELKRMDEQEVRIEIEADFFLAFGTWIAVFGEE